MEKLPRRAISRIASVAIIIAILVVSAFAAGLLVVSAGLGHDVQSSNSSVSITQHSTSAAVLVSSSSSSSSTTKEDSTPSTSLSTTATCNLGTSTTPDAIWTSALHGVDYTWGAVFNGNGSTTPPPVQAFPIIKSMGFNLVRVPLSWNMLEQNQTAYLGYLSQIATEANHNGIYVMYDAHTSGSGKEPGFFFPSSLNSTYGSGSAFLTSWWEQGVTFNGKPGWTALWDEFWTPVIKTVDCYKSTLGYELESEPKIEGAPMAALQQFNQNISTEMREVTEKYIAFMAPGEGMNSVLDAEGAPANVSNVVLDAHCYISQSSCSNPPLQLAALSNFSDTTHVTVWIGEWAVDSGCCVPQNQSQSIVQEYVSLFHEYNFASSYWSWSCSSTIIDTALLSGTDCQPYWLTYQVSAAQG